MLLLNILVVCLDGLGHLQGVSCVFKVLLIWSFDRVIVLWLCRLQSIALFFLVCCFATLAISVVGSITLRVVLELLDFDEGVVDLGCSRKLLTWSAFKLRLTGLLVLDAYCTIILLIEMHRR